MLKYYEEKKKISAQKIQEMFREKRTKEKLFIGFDSSEFIILRIYVKEYDENKKVKSIEIHSYSLIQKKELILIKTIKELLGVDSLSSNSVKKVMNEIIEKVLQQNDESINLDKLSEIQKETNNNNKDEKDDNDNNDKNENIDNKDDKKDNDNKDNNDNINNPKKSYKAKYNEEEIMDNNKDEFVIENNEENYEDKNKESKKNDNIHNDSSIEDANYDF